MKQRRILILSAATLSIAAMLVTHQVLQARSAPQAQQAPMFEVDPMWPKPLPNRWLFGSVVGVAIDSRDHVFVVHRRDTFTARTETGAAQNPPTGDCCIPAPEVMEFDAQGNLVSSFAGPGAGHVWPAQNHRIAIDNANTLWIGGSSPSDSHIIKFSRDGKFVAHVGKTAAAPAPTAARGSGAADTAYTGVSGAGRAAGGGGAAGQGRGRAGGRGGAPAAPPTNSVADAFGGPAKITFDVAAREAYVADGYRNRRIVVLDMNTGAVKRMWGAYGKPASDSVLPPYDPNAAPSQHFRTPHCAEPTTDGFVYVCDRGNNRIQVFRKDGTFVKEKAILPKTLGNGSVWDIAFSRDPQQRFLYVADGQNMRVHILDRQSLEVLTSFGDGGRQPGQFLAVHSIATDSQGNIYTTESSEGKRIQKHVFRGIGPVTKKDQGVLWPRR